MKVLFGMPLRQTRRKLVAAGRAKLESAGLQHLVLRPKTIKILSCHSASTIPATVHDQQVQGNVIRYRVACRDITLTVDSLNQCADHRFPDGACVHLAILRDTLHEVS